MPRLILNPGTPVAREFELKPGLNRIGRRIEGNDISIADLSISGVHCEINVTEGKVTVEDLGSTNGTYVDGAPVRQAALKSGQTVHLGNVQLLYSEQSRSSAPVRIPGGPAVRMVTRDSKAGAGSGVAAGVGGHATPSLERVEIPMPPPPVEPAQDLSAIINRSTVSLPAIDAGDHKCRTHAKTIARFQCPQCRQYFCGLCVVTRPGAGEARFCRNCSVPCIPLRVEKPKSESPTGFFGRLPGAAVYPFKGSGLLILLAATIVFAVLNALSLPLIGVIVGIIAIGYMFSYLQNIIHSTVAGEDAMPDMPDWSDVLGGFLRFVGTMAISFLPALLLTLAQAQYGKAVPDVLIWAAVVLGCLYYPMAFLAVCMKDTLMAANPMFVVASILAVPFQYLVAALLVLGVFGVREAGSSIFSWLTFQGMSQGSVARLAGIFLARMLWAFVGMYLLTVSMRVLGLLYLTNKERLGWFSR